MRWKQVYNKNLAKYELIPVGEAAHRGDHHFIQDDFHPFISPIDKTVVSGRRQYAEHCKKHDVVNAAEFGPEHYAQKARERADHYEGRTTRAEQIRRRENIHEIINHLGRADG